MVYIPEEYAANDNRPPVPSARILDLDSYRPKIQKMLVCFLCSVKRVYKFPENQHVEELQCKCCLEYGYLFDR